MTYATDRFVLFIDAPKASGCYLVDAPNDEATKGRLDDDVSVATTEPGKDGAEWIANDVALRLEGKGWTISWLDLVEVAL